MKALSVAGTAAMFLVGGGIIAHGIGPLHHAVEGFTAATPLPGLLEAVANALIGIAAGALVLAAVAGARRVKGAAA